MGAWRDQQVTNEPDSRANPGSGAVTARGRSIAEGSRAPPRTGCAPLGDYDRGVGHAATASAIGTLRERPLHASLKRWYARPGDRVEVAVDGYVVDLVRGDLLIEIQTRGFATLRPKLHGPARTRPPRPGRAPDRRSTDGWSASTPTARSSRAAARRGTVRSSTSRPSSSASRTSSAIPASSSTSCWWSRRRSGATNPAAAGAARVGRWSSGGWWRSSRAPRSPRRGSRLPASARPARAVHHRGAGRADRPSRGGLAQQLAYCLRGIGLIEASGSAATPPSTSACGAACSLTPG